MDEQDVTKLLNQVGTGDEKARQLLLKKIYEVLRRQAGARMRGERPGHTLQPTELVNEAWLRLVRGEPRWENRAHFFGAAAEVMRRILVDHARARLSEKRGGNAQRVTFNELNVESQEPDLDLLAMDEALAALESEHPRLALVVKLRYFAGMTVEETAGLLDQSPRTIKRDWTYAKAWLFARLEG